MTTPTKDSTQPVLFPQVLSKIHKLGNPLSPFVSSREAVTYGKAKELANIIWPLVGQSPPPNFGNPTFYRTGKSLQLQQWGCLVFYNIKVLHIDSNGLCHIHNQKQATPGPSPTPWDLHVYPVYHHLAGHLPSNTYFLFQGKYFEQVHGAAMDSPISPQLQICSWKSLKSEPSVCPHPPRLYLKYVDDTFVIQQAEHSH